MTKPLRLQPIPGQHDPHLARIASQKANSIMATDALRDLPFAALLDVVEAVIEARPDVDGPALEKHSDRLRRIAWKNGA